MGHEGAGTVEAIGEGVTLIGMATLAASLVLILGGLDVSVGSLVGFCSAAAGVAMIRIDSPLAGIAAALLVGMVGGLVNGIGVTKGKIEPIIVTLATYSAYRGFALLTTGGYAVNVRNAAFNHLGNGTVLGIPITIMMLLAAIFSFIYLLSHTTVGRNIYAIGGNPDAARLAARRLHSGGLNGGPGGHYTLLAHQVRAADLWLRGFGVAGNHGGHSGRHLNQGRQGHDHRCDAGRPNHRHPQ